MQNQAELQHVIYHLLKTQIDFGVHRFGQALPTIQETSQYFGTGVDTVRRAYLRLKQEGYISLRTCVGAVLRVDYSEREIDGHIRGFFSARKHTLRDFALSCRILFSRAQWTALKHASPQALNELERLCAGTDLAAPYRMSQQLLRVYRPLGNELFMRLVWQMFSFFQGPFLSLPHNEGYFSRAKNPFLEMIALSRQADWDGLWRAIEAYYQQLLNALDDFLRTDMAPDCGEAQQTGFLWSIYKKTSQHCYSLAMELLRAIRQGEYPAGGFLPAPAALAEEKRVCLSTVRRTIALLKRMGAVRSINGVGTQVLPPPSFQSHSALADATIQKRLLDFAQSLQILCLSCRRAAEAAVSAMDEGDIRQWVGQLDEMGKSGQQKLVGFACLERIHRFVPCQAVRTVYAQLLEQHVWGYPLRDLHGSAEEIDRFYQPYLIALRACLSRGDHRGFAALLEKLQRLELSMTVERLTALGVPGASAILLPESAPTDGTKARP